VIWIEYVVLDSDIREEYKYVVPCVYIALNVFVVRSVVTLIFYFQQLTPDSH